MSKFFHSLSIFLREQPKKFTIILAVLILLLSLFVYSSLLLKSNMDQRTNAARQHATLVSDLSTRLPTLLKRYNKTNARKRPNILNEMISVAQERYNFLLSGLKSNPQTFLSEATLADTASSYPAGVSELLEKKVDLTGRLKKVMTDDFKSNISIARMEFVSDDQNTPSYQTTFTSDPTDDLLTIPKVHLSGISLDNMLVVDKNNISPVTVIPEGIAGSPELMTGLPSTLSSGNVKTLVIIFKQADNTTELLTPSDVNGYIFDNQYSVKNYFSEVSNNKLTLVKDTNSIQGWYQLVIGTKNGCPYQNWSDEADSIALGRGVNPADYGFRIYIFPPTDTCAWYGLSEYPGNRIWINGGIYHDITIDVLNRFAVAHETVHTMGLIQHSAASCGSDYFDLMAPSANFVDPVHLTSYYKERLGWLNPGDVTYVNQSASYTLTVYEQATGQPKVLKIPAGAGKFYYLEYRKNVNFDSLQNGDPFGHTKYFDVNGGVIIHKNTSPNIYTDLIDTTPGDSLCDNAALQLTSGRSGYTDSAAGINIQLVGTTATTATLNITVPTTASPTPTTVVATPTTGVPTPTIMPPLTVCSDTSQCNPGDTCVEDCGPPVIENDPSSSISPTPYLWHCLNPAEAASRQRFGCPICLTFNTKIQTPAGERPVQDLKIGDLVYTLDKNGKKQIVPIKQVSSVNAPAGHLVADLVLNDGRVLSVSPSHPLMNGRKVTDIHDGELYDGAAVVSHGLRNYQYPKTYDLLPEGVTGYYYANDIPVASTLK